MGGRTGFAARHAPVGVTTGAVAADVEWVARDGDGNASEEAVALNHWHEEV
jgi:hypothetical protein